MYDFISSKGVDPETEFDLIELVGQGNYGRVYKAFIIFNCINLFI